MTNSLRHGRPKLCSYRLFNPPRRLSLVTSSMLLVLVMSHDASAKGEPAEAFVKQLRNAGYFDTAITYLDRAATMAGVDQSFVTAIPLEKAQTYIETALHSRNAADRDMAFADAESALSDFLGGESHPRQSEARLQLGKLQMIRAAQLLAGAPVETEKQQARESYLAAAKTFDGIVSDLRGKLESMRGQKIDPKADPEAAALRDQYRFEFLQSQLNAADAIKLAAKTYAEPAEQGKAQLEDAAKRFEELNKKYSGYSPGAIALSHLGELNETLGKPDVALDYYLRMLEEPAVDQLREAKFSSAAGVIRIKLASKPPAYQEALDRAAGWAKEIRPNEESLPIVQEFRIQLAKAYLAKAADESLKKGEIGRAKSDGRDLLRAASKVPGPHVEQAKAMLADLGIEQETETLPTAEPPSSFDDALEKATQVVTVTSDLEEALKVIQGQEETPELKKQIADIEKQIRESYFVGIQVLRGGLAMVTADTNVESLNQARQILAYFLYQTKRLRETVVVGNFLARNAPGTELGLKGGLMALTSMQMLLNEVPEDANEGLIRQLESLGNFLAKTWPDDPNAAAAQGLQIRLLLKKDDFDGAQALIEEMSAGNERASFKRLLGQLLWNESIVARAQENDDAKSDALLDRARQNLQSGLDEIEGNLVEVEGMQAATVLAKIHLMKDDSAAALKVLDHSKYGPLHWISKLGSPSESFTGELYSTELKALVGRMLDSDTPETFLDRMTATMEKLRGAYKGEESQTKLTQTYMRLAGDLKEQLDTATPARKVKLIEAFRVMLKRISDATDDTATLRWVGQTLMSMGEASMEPGQVKAAGQAADLLNQSVETFRSLPDQNDPTTAYLLGRAQRLVGEYKASIDTFESLLKAKPTMLEAQIEAAKAYESWAGTLPPNIAYKAYRAALEGARPGDDKKNTIWGWAETSSKTSKLINRNENFKEKFFESRYHVALCLYLMGKSAKRDADIRKAIKVIREAATLFPELGGPERRAEYNALMKEAQRSVGDDPVGIAQPDSN
ncbi:hypothetical protein Mal15_13150 [Stieleria maiorica]|uniref:Tetratricopeptide repeat protein n=1 Tax=Stieleria maiorica TaxID=2795974 RepID=A0A5B9MAM2_9BACT|nr:hypothetical protein [Stieleria maiorica]QEF97276.1 hypothetical protein Mal15_13150 [Stieleria maiorica]